MPAPPAVQVVTSANWAAHVPTACGPIVLPLCRGITSQGADPLQAVTDCDLAIIEC
jgi:hypothetical protein